MSEQPAVAVEALSKRYGRTWALRDCSFQVPANRVIALVGSNGAGKSTLMSIISGLLPATSGSFRAVGRVAILAQDKPLYRDFSVSDMLRFGRRTNRVWDQKRALSWLQRFDTPMDRRCGRLSGGQRAQVALAVALGSRPELLLLDEPLSNLDPVARNEVMGELMAEVAETGLTVMLSTHIVAELAGVGDHLLLLADGRPVLTGDVEELTADHVRMAGPLADQPPCAGTVIQEQHTERQSTFVLRLAAGAGSTPIVAPGWSSQPLSLEDIVLTYLKTSGRIQRTAEAAA